MNKSISNKQLSANRKNALKSTGPKTVEGKAIVARNAMTHGLRAQHVLIEGESLVAKIVVGFWRFWRARRIENEIMYCLGEEPAESKAGQLCRFGW